MIESGNVNNIKNIKNDNIEMNNSLKTNKSFSFK